MVRAVLTRRSRRRTLVTWLRFTRVLDTARGIGRLSWISLEVLTISFIRMLHSGGDLRLKSV